MTTRLDLRADCIEGVESAKQQLADLAELLKSSTPAVVGAGRAKDHVDSAWRLVGYALEALT